MATLFSVLLVFVLTPEAQRVSVCVLDVGWAAIGLPCAPPAGIYLCELDFDIFISIDFRGYEIYSVRA